LCLDISPRIETDFRHQIGRYLGNKRGNLRLAVEQAFQLWISKKEQESRLASTARPWTIIVGNEVRPLQQQQHADRDSSLVVSALDGDCP
jgi:hypothetical protein